jgi:16S rRNA (cytosine1402-N4)-methyltransferase
MVYRAIPAGKRVKNIHPATRIFQAIRIEVNNELTAIGESLDKAHKYLAPGGLLIAISFHSLEDRIVKNTFRRLAAGCSCGKERPECGCSGAPFVKILTRKPVTPEQDEIRTNRRSRSAKLRVCAKL